MNNQGLIRGNAVRHLTPGFADSPPTRHDSRGALGTISRQIRQRHTTQAFRRRTQEAKSAMTAEIITREARFV